MIKINQFGLDNHMKDASSSPIDSCLSIGAQQFSSTCPPEAGNYYPKSIKLYLPDHEIYLPQIHIILSKSMWHSDSLTGNRKLQNLPFPNQILPTPGRWLMLTTQPCLTLYSPVVIKQVCITWNWIIRYDFERKDPCNLEHIYRFLQIQMLMFF